MFFGWKFPGICKFTNSLTSLHCLWRVEISLFIVQLQPTKFSILWLIISILLGDISRRSMKYNWRKNVSSWPGIEPLHGFLLSPLTPRWWVNDVRVNFYCSKIFWSPNLSLEVLTFELPRLHESAFPWKQPNNHDAMRNTSRFDSSF